MDQSKMNSNILEIDLTEFAEYYCNNYDNIESKDCISKELNTKFLSKVLLSTNFTTKKVLPVIKLVYQNKITDTDILRKLWKQYVEGSGKDSKELFINNLVKSIIKQNDTNVTMKRLINKKETSEELENTIEKMRKEIATLKNSNEQKHSIILNQKKKLIEKDELFNNLNVDFKLQKSKINHQDETIDMLKQIMNIKSKQS